MRPIYILGSGGFAKEVYFLIQSIGNYEVKAFIDIESKPSITIGRKNIDVIGESFLSSLSTTDNYLAIGVGQPDLIHKLSSMHSAFHFPNLIHPNVVGNFEDIGMGYGNIITANCIFTTSIRIGSYNIFNLSTTIGHDVVIGDCNVINPAVNISGGVEIGNRNLLGVNSTILQYKKIGNNTVVGASSLVNKDVAERTTVVGVPAKPLGK